MSGVNEWYVSGGNHYQVCNCGNPVNEEEHSSDAWVNDNGTHKKVCDVCEAEFANGTCDGGEATCGSPATCSVCGYTYGDPDANGHVPSGVWVTENGIHWQECSVDGCDAKIYEAACEGGYATCSEKAICVYCGEEYGILAPHSYSGDCDRICDECDDVRDVTASHTYQNGCDATCDVCREVRAAAHTYTNACDECCNVCFALRTPANHTGGTASCTERAICSVCGAEYGQLADHAFTSSMSFDSVRHWRECVCGAKTDEADHAYGEWSEYGNSMLRSCACGHYVTSSAIADKKSLGTGILVFAAVGGAVTFGTVAFGIWTLLSKKRI